MYCIISQSHRVEVTDEKCNKTVEDGIMSTPNNKNSDQFWTASAQGSGASGKYLLRPLLIFCCFFFACTSVCLARDLVVGVYANEPKIFFDKNHVAAGMHIEVLNRIAQAEHWNLHYVPCEWLLCLHALARGEIDLLPDVGYTDARSKIYDFHTVPALYSWSILYRNRDVQINSVFDLKHKRVAMLEHAIQAEYFHKLLEDTDIEVSFVNARTIEEAFELVAAGKADVVVANQQAGDLMSRRHGLLDTPIVFQPIKLFFATTKGKNADVLFAIDKHLAAWQADPQSIYFDILRKWGPERRSPLSKFILWGLAAAIVLFLTAFAMAAYLRREVALRTRALRNSEQSLRIAATVFQSQEAMWVVDPDQRVLNVNDAFVKLTGYRLEDLPQQGIVPFNLENDSQDYRESMWRIVRQSGQWQAEVQSRKKNGEEYMMRLTLTAVRDAQEKVTHYVGTQTDITQQKILQKETARLAYYDSLTGLPNRQLLARHILQAIAANTDETRVGGLLVIDLDNFKDLNDTLGHDIGDQLLQQVAQRLLSIGTEQEAVSRLGGDEFVLLLQGVPKESAKAMLEQVAQRVLSLLNERFSLSGISHHTTCSIGGTLVEDSQSSVQDILRRGDLAMYQAKRNGRNTYCLFSTDMENAVNFRTAIEADLRVAIDQQQMFLHYQPQVDDAGRLIGAEALLRWQHPVRGLISPGIFIPIAEASGLIVPIGRWVLQQACQQAALWQAQRPGHPIVVAVNVSALQFRHSQFTSQVLDVVAENGINPNGLKLELTETMMVEDVEEAIEKMHLLKSAGISFALDDFGTGYSSLSLLKRLPIDQLKIDQSFIKDLLIDPDDAAIAKSIIALGRALGIEIIAEGVETLAQRDFLSRLGCHYFQGYLFGHPGPAAQLLF